MVDQIPVLIVPGVGNSGPEHWQTRWEVLFPYCRRVEQDDWDRPDCARWLERLELAVRTAGPRSMIVAHSLGCLLVAHWAGRFLDGVAGALLVAPPDPRGKEFPTEARGFTPLPHSRWSFPSILVGSTNDPYGELEFAESCARAWGSRLVNLGAKGHINAASGLGDWPEGHALLLELMGSHE